MMTFLTSLLWVHTNVYSVKGVDKLLNMYFRRRYIHIHNHTSPHPLLLRSEEMLERISFLSCHAHNQLAVSWMKIWIAKETVMIEFCFRLPNHRYHIFGWWNSMSVYVWPCTGTCMSDAISHQNVASYFASFHSLSPQSKVFIIISYPNHVILKIILLKYCEKEDLDNQAETYCFPQYSLKGCVILTHLFLLWSFYL